MIEYLLFLIMAPIYAYYYFTNKYKRNLKKWSRSQKWFPSQEDEYFESSNFLRKSKNESDRMIFCGGDDHGNLVKISMEKNSENTASADCQFWMADGRKFEMDEEPVLFICSDWTTSGVSFQLLEPFKAWRIVVNGMMKCDNDYVHVNMRLLWHAMSGPIHYYVDHKNSFLCYSVKRRDDEYTGYDQYGILTGTVSIDCKESIIHLLSMRHRSWNDIGHIYVMSDYQQIFTVNYIKQKYCLGHFMKINRSYDVFRRDDFTLQNKKCSVSINTPSGRIFYTLDRNEASNDITHTDDYFVFNFSNKRSLLVLKTPPISILNIPKLSPDSGKIITDLTSPYSLNSRFVGGKAANLAILKSLWKDHFLKINVPGGFCVTVEAFRRHICSNDTLKEQISKLINVSDNDLEVACEKIVSLWLSSSNSDDILKQELEEVLEDKVYAVRSSGIDEDLGSTSAAGQNESVLGVIGVENVVKNVLVCWASLFSYPSVQYRRQNGISVTSSEMCVLVQELVMDVKAGGVLFSCNPVSGHTWTTVISSTFGLGLTVVNGVSDPDSFILIRDTSGEFLIKEKHCGVKSKIEYRDGAIKSTLTLSHDENSKYSLDNIDLIRLSKIGWQIKQLFGYECDIEWVLDENNVIHIVQVRPITSLNHWTDFELTHEFDSPIHERYDATTIHNIGEGLPGFTSPLNISVAKIYDDTMHHCLKFLADKNVIVTNFLFYAYHMTINLMNTLFVVEDDPISQIIICGEIISTPELQTLIKIRNGPHKSTKILKMMMFLVKEWLMLDYSTGQSTYLSQDLWIEQNDCPQIMFNNIYTSLAVLHQVAYHHISCTMIVSTYQNILIQILTGGKKEDVSPEDISILANSIISHTNVVSANIPQLFQNIVECIVQKEKGIEFLKVNPEYGEEWLKVHCSEAFDTFQEFLCDHGHRCNKELELMSESWAMNRPNVIKIIQNMVETSLRMGEHIKHSQDKAQYIFDSKAVNFLLPYAKKAVAKRENTKNALVKTFDKIRQSFRHLGKIMQEGGLIPYSDLVFYFSLYELKQMIVNSRVSFVNKALRRKKLANSLDKLQFEKQSIGRPTFVTKEKKLCSVGKTLSGTPIWQGEVTGIARVLIHLEDAHQIQQGDILITHSTDTGWTPYFSILGGLVTELGGLLSHGAVVAREYGLPCIVSVGNATLYFQTGDKILLNSTKGTIKKILNDSNSDILEINDDDDV